MKPRIGVITLGVEDLERAATSSAEAQPSEREAYEALQFYTLAHGGPAFIHQHVVDAWAAQRADGGTKPIALTFALVGLYLHLEKGFTGRQVQRAHMALARRKRAWPSFALPEERGAVTATEVMAANAGPERDREIDRWCDSVWAAFAESHRQVAELLEEHGFVWAEKGTGDRFAPVPTRAST